MAAATWCNGIQVVCSDTLNHNGGPNDQAPNIPAGGQPHSWQAADVRASGAFLGETEGEAHDLIH